jgi:hypothetical protein
MAGLFQPNVFQNPLVFQVQVGVSGVYRALMDIFLPDLTYVEAGTTFTGPPGWIPAVAVDPVDTNGIQAYWNLGPVMMDNAEISRCLFPYGDWMRRTGVLVAAPKVYWTPTTGGKFILTGSGASLGPKSAP